MGFFQAGRREGRFDNGVQWMLERLLVDSNFLFRIERDPADAKPGRPHKLSDYELASRLSFFLWSSISDDELLGLAERGRLREAAIVERQVRRMLADPKSDALVANFAGQWLFLRNLRGIAPDSTVFPEFDDNLRDAFQQETELFLKDQLREDRSVRELLTANYAFLNDWAAGAWETQLSGENGSQEYEVLAGLRPGKLDFVKLLDRVRRRRQRSNHQAASPLRLQRLPDAAPGCHAFLFGRPCRRRGDHAVPCFCRS